MATNTGNIGQHKNTPNIKNNIVWKYISNTVDINTWKPIKPNYNKTWKYSCDNAISTKNNNNN